MNSMQIMSSSLFILAMVTPWHEVSCFTIPRDVYAQKPKVVSVTAAKSPLFMVLKDRQDEKLIESRINGAKLDGDANELNPFDEPAAATATAEQKASSSGQNVDVDIDVDMGISKMIDVNVVNGESAIDAAIDSIVSTTKSNTSNSSSLDILGLVEEINDQIMAGSNQLFQNMTDTLENKLVSVVPDTTKAVDLSKLLTDMTRDIQKAQQEEIQRQLDDIERKLVRPLEELAFSDAPLFEPAKSGAEVKDNGLSEEEKKKIKQEHRRELVIAGVNSTLGASSRSLRTKEIVRNLNVAPFYYSITLLLRWLRKVSAPPLAMLTLLKGAGSIIQGSGQKSYSETIKDGEAMQQGWRRTGEIAAKGTWARKVAIFRRSLEIWAYFSSFYIKEKRMTSKFESGKWTAEKFSEERSKLGAEITQNLLKLGPTFIKVRKCYVFYSSCLSAVRTMR